MKGSIKTEAEKTNNKVECDPSNFEPAQMKDSSEKKDSDNDAVEAISEYINKSKC
jgi:hypothetical protein